MVARPVTEDIAAPPGSAGAVSGAEFRSALSGLATAVSVIATKGPAGTAGLTCSAVCGAGEAPPMVIACVNRKSAANETIKANGVLCINCLPASRRDLSQIFAGAGQVPMAARFSVGEWSELATGAPYCKDALVAFDCELAEAREVGSHSVLIGRVVATAQNPPAEPLVHHRQQYATTRVL